MTEQSPTDGARDANAAALPAELRLLELFASRHGMVMGPADAERLLGGSKANWSPKLKLLAEAGYLEQAGTPGKYAMGGKVFELAVGYLATLGRQLSLARTEIDQRAAFLQRVLAGLISAFPTAGPGGES